MGDKSRLDFGDLSPENSLMHAGTVIDRDTGKVKDIKPDFSGWATKANLRCSDGRTILPGAFEHQDQAQVPLVWQHGHNEPTNVLGHVILENRDEGVRAFGYFNDTDQGKNAKTLVEHKDITALSIFANQLVEKMKKVSHGIIREVSLVLSGANPGALIDNIELQHGDGDLVTIDDEAIIFTGETLVHGDAVTGPGEPPKPADDDDNDTVQVVYDGMTPEQKEVVHFFVGAALESKGDDDDDSNDDSNDDSTATHSGTDPGNQEGRTMKRNVFEQQNPGSGNGTERHVLSHDAIKGIVEDAHRVGSLKEAVEAYALKHGIDNIDVLFPDARNVSDTPEFDKRRTEWVAGVINGTKHSPFSRIKSLVADITHADARARGYIKGNMKKEEYFGLTSRVTTPSTVYKKQKLDRDDIIDITDMDVVAWLKGEMRLMLDEELARAVLIGDGRPVDDEDKIKDPMGSTEGAGIRSILNDHDLYAATVNVNIDDANSSPVEIIDQIILNMRFYKGTGSPTLYTTLPVITKLLLAKDTLGRRLYRTVSDLASEMGVSGIVAVEVMEDVADTVIGIIVNLQDYTMGADRGGDVSMFDDFDIDYNQYKYLIETRCSGALTKIRSALVIKKVAGASVLVEPQEPGYDDASGEITVPTVANVVYHRSDTDAVVNTAGSPYAVPEGGSLTIYAVPTGGHYFSNNVEDQWTFENTA